MYILCITFEVVAWTNPGFINNLCTAQPIKCYKKSLQVNTECNIFYCYKIKHCNYFKLQLAAFGFYLGGGGKL